MSPAIAALFLFGVFWKRATAPAALYALVIGLAGGMARLAADLIMRHDGAAVATLKQQLYQRLITATQFDAAIAPIKTRHPAVFEFWNVNWLYYAQFLLFLTAAVMVVVSLATKAPDASVMRYTWYGATAAEKAATRASWSARDVVLSVIVLAAVVAFYIAFW